ncbi:MAG TPA: hypothetical protein VFG10_16205 [Saprospiraceae bacterium]|nr:hypothetical protein [Saprospiraceae bacterium]
MTLYADSIQIQIDLIEEAMKKAGVWSTEIPDWITRYREEPIPDIWQWLQYIYLPMRLKGAVHKPHYIAPLLRPYMNTESPFKEILHLVIQLDSISSTIQKK